MGWKLLILIWFFFVVGVAIFLGLYIGFLVYRNGKQKFTNFIKRTFKKEK